METLKEKKFYKNRFNNMENLSFGRISMVIRNLLLSASEDTAAEIIISS